MIKCTISGCDDFASETFTDKVLLSRWLIIRACRCAAATDKMRSCTCRSEGPVPISYWPNLDWWAFGGVEEVILCPDHRKIVANMIVEQRELDPSMNPTKRDPYNRH
jgi:hypothetical protein